MKISEIIAALEKKKAAHGDIAFCYWDDYLEAWEEVRGFSVNVVHPEGRYEIDAKPGDQFLSIRAHVFKVGDPSETIPGDRAAEILEEEEPRDTNPETRPPHFDGGQAALQG